MKKHFTQLVLTLFVALLFVQLGSSQNVIWGGPGDANGEFDGGLNDWTSISVSPDTINAQWIWEADAKADRGAYSGNSSVLFSPSASNGAAVFDSDFYDNDGIGGNFGNGIAAATQKGELMSPEFSCAGNDEVWVKFYQSYRNYKSGTSLVVSNDGGDTWSPPFNFNTEVALNASTKTNSVLFVNISEYASNQENVRIKFVFDANYYFWIIDDVSILDGLNADPRITRNWYSPVNYRTPAYLSKNKTFDFKMEAMNFGGAKDMSGVTAKVSLVKAASGTVLFEESQTFDMTIKLDSANEVILDTAKIDFSSYTSPEVMDTGLYNVIYELDYSDAASVFGKKVVHYFRIMPGVNEEYTIDESNNEFVSVTARLSYDDGSFGRGVGWQGGSTADVPLYFVSQYKTGDWVESDAVDIRAIELDQRVGKVGSSDLFNYPFEMSMFLLADTVAEDFSNFANGEDNGIIIDGVTNTNLEYLGSASEAVENADAFDFNSFPVTDSEGENDFVSLIPNKRYLISTFFDASETDYFRIGTDNGEPLDEQFNSETRYSYGENIRALRYYPGDGWATYTSSYGTWQLGMTTQLVRNVTSTEDLLPENTVVLANNPVKDNLTVNINFENTVDKATMAIHTVNGAIIDMRSISNLKQDTQTFNTGNLPQGSYIFTIFTKEKVLSKKFVVVK